MPAHIAGTTMDVSVRIKMNENLYLRDPEATELGKKIVRHSILMIHQIGFEQFTFKKLAAEINTTEAGIYRYFENKHRLLVYIVAWYWSLLEYLVVVHINNLTDPGQKLRRVIDLLSKEPEAILGSGDLDNSALYQIVIAESNKAYLTKDVTANNEAKMFKPYKDLCARIARLILEYNPAYPFPHSLSSTLIETAHLQYFFMHHLPSLTDFGKDKDSTRLRTFLEVLLFSNLNTDHR